MRVLLIRAGDEPALGRLAPLDDPLGGADPHLQRQVGPGRSLARERLDRAQLGELALVPGPDRFNDREPPLGQAVGEEQLQHPFVAELVARLGVGLQPALERGRPRRGQLVDGAGAAA
jgi:hypothetical protein